MDAGKDDYMPTTRQHFVPKSYLKAWETSVRNSHEPTKRFEGVYVFTDKAGKGEGRNTKSILWSQSLYTVKYADYLYIHGKYPEIDNDFIYGIREVLCNDFLKPINASYSGNSIISDQDILDSLVYLDDWDFFYDDGTVAPKKRIINQIKNLSSQCLEKGLDDVFEKSWAATRDSFISAVEKEVKNKKTSPYCIPREKAEQMVRFFYSMLCRNPEFDSFGIYTKVKDRILRPVGLTEELIEEIMRPQWIGELYRMVFGGSGGFFNLGIAQTFQACQMILFQRYADACHFITSDNPSFRYVSMVEVQNLNGFYFPLGPDYLLMIAKGKDGIEKVDYRFADDVTVRMINRKIYNSKTKLLVANQRYLPI